jgi:hypothetical protein
MPTKRTTKTKPAAAMPSVLRLIVEKLKAGFGSLFGAVFCSFALAK